MDRALAHGISTGAAAVISILSEFLRGGLFTLLFAVNECWLFRTTGLAPIVGASCSRWVVPYYTMCILFALGVNLPFTVSLAHLYISTYCI